MSGLTEQATFKSHSDWVWAVAMHGDHVVSCSDDYSAKVWSLSKKKLLGTYTMHKWAIRAVVVLPDATVLTGSVDETVKIWDMHTGVVKRSLSTPATVISLAVTGDHVVAGLLNGDIYIFSYSTGKELHRFPKAHKDDVDRITAYGDYIVSGGADTLIKVFSISQRKHLRTLLGHKKTVHGVQVVNGEYVVSGSSDMTLKIWDLQTGKLIRSKDSAGGICCLYVEKGIIYTGHGSGIGAYAFPSLNELWKPIGADGTVEGLYAIGDRVVSGTRSHTVKTWKLRGNVPDPSMTTQTYPGGTASTQTTGSFHQSIKKSFAKLATKPFTEQKEALKPLPPMPKPKPAKPVNQWAPGDVQKWLQTLGHRYESIKEFVVDLEIDGPMLLELTVDDVKENSKVTPLVAKMFLKAITKLKKESAVGAANPTIAPSPSVSSIVSTSSTSSAPSKNMGSSGGATDKSMFAQRTMDSAQDTGAVLDDRLTPFFGVRKAPKMGLIAAAKHMVQSNTPVLQVPDLVSRAEWAVERCAKRQRKYVKRLRKNGKASEASQAEASGTDANGLTVQEAAAVNLYTQSGSSPLYSVINKLMRERSRELAIPAFPYLRLLLEALEKLPPYKEPIWRGVALNLLEEYEDEKDEQVMWWQFSSCTTDLKLLQDNTMFLGTQGARTLFMVQPLHAVSIADYSDFPEEAEVLLPPARLEVVSAMVMDQSSGAVLVQLKEVQQKGKKLIQ